MTHVVLFSGGKDSTALIVWAKEHLRGEDVRYVFCDTGWEHPFTLAYIDQINASVLDGALVTVRTEKFANGMIDLVQAKKMIPRNGARFCTEELKIKPTILYVKGINDDVTIYQGVRADESRERRAAGRQLWSDAYDCWIVRPLFDWTAEQVFTYTAVNNVPPNPLYRHGASRVGCFPCVLVSLSDLKMFSKTLPQVWDKIREMEASSSGRHFFKPNYIPDRFATGEKDGKRYPTVDDVYRYVNSATDQQLALLDVGRPTGCVSVYNVCE